MKSSPKVTLTNATRAKEAFEATLDSARQVFAAELADLQARLTDEDDLASLPSAVAAVMNRFKTACADACAAFAQRSDQVTASTRPTENLDFFGTP